MDTNRVTGDIHIRHDEGELMLRVAKELTLVLTGVVSEVRWALIDDDIKHVHHPTHRVGFFRVTLNGN